MPPLTGRQEKRYIFPQLLLGGLRGQAARPMVGISLVHCDVEPRKATRTCTLSYSLAHMAYSHEAVSRPPRSRREVVRRPL